LRFVIIVSLILASTAAPAAVFEREHNAPIGDMVAQSYDELCTVAAGTNAYLNKGRQYDPSVIHAGVAQDFGADLKRVQQTLDFICDTISQDKLLKRVSRLGDAAFISEHFEMIRWRPNKQQSRQFEDNKPLLQRIPDDQILLTKYYIKKAQGSTQKTVETPHALYAIPHDEANLTLEQADVKRGEISRYRYTKHQVLSGILDKKALASPLVWLSRDDLEDTLMQGTVMIEGADKPTFYNVHRNNGIGYKRDLKKRQQQRYWYFKQTDSVLGYGKDANYKIPIFPHATVAGDLAYLGLGKLIMLSSNGQSRLTILADTGGAFVDNQYQLDYLGGYFYNWADYIKTYRHFPDYFEARILLLKTKPLSADVDGASVVAPVMGK